MTVMTLDRAAVIFNGTYTVQNRTTGEHRTFRIDTQSSDAAFSPGKRIVALLNGPNNTSDYEGFGFVDDVGIYVWRKKAQRADPKKPTTWEWFAHMLWDLTVRGGTQFGDRYDVKVAGSCLRCNRPLTTPDSIARGIGPVCAEMD